MVGVEAAWADGTGPAMRLEFKPVWSGKSLTGNKFESRPEVAAVTRLDLLLSNLAVRGADGKWMESADWYAFLSFEKGLLTAEATGLPAQELTGVRFDVGVPKAVNEGDPAQWEPGHALHPDHNGLHWGWQGGYIFMALEGRWRRPDGALSGFSYHFAQSENITRVELPVTFRGGGPVTLRVDFDAARVLRDIDFQKDGTSSHSRAGDAVVPRLRTALGEAFAVTGVRYDLFQPAPRPSPDAAPLPAGTTPYAWRVTERFPRVALPADNPLTEEGVSLGRLLFEDPRLSINNTQSCASCHQRNLGFADPRPVSPGATGTLGRRQSIPLINLAWAPSFFWDGRASTLRQQVLMPIQDAHEMQESLPRVIAKLEKDKALAADFARAFGSPGITQERLAMALEQFALTLVAQDSKFDRAVRKQAELTPEEKRGLELFVTEFDPARGLRGADCFHCHGGTLFTDHKFASNGLDPSPLDAGRSEVTKNEADRGKFKTPSLRNVALTAPYMHDGRFRTLEEVVDHYDHGVKRTPNLDPNLAKHPDSGLGLSAADKQALVAFLKTLTDASFVPSATHTASSPR